jgi:hypothetical protein
MEGVEEDGLSAQSYYRELVKRVCADGNAKKAYQDEVLTSWTSSSGTCHCLVILSAASGP